MSKEGQQNANAKKSEQLGMSLGKAQHQLRKSLLFNLAYRCGMGNCYRCGKPIETLRELSIEHKEAWLDSDDPVGLFFDIDNIAFSHLSCNSASTRHNKPGSSTVVKVGKTGYRGVLDNNYRGRKGKNFMVKLWDGKKDHFVGYYDAVVDAAKAYDEAAIKMFGVDAVTNESLGLLETV